MKNELKSGSISSSQLFLMLLASRVAVSLTNIQAISVGTLAPDMLISVVLALGLVLLSSLPVLLCIKKGRRPDSIALRLAYSAYFVLYAAVSATRLAYFASSRMAPFPSVTAFVIVLIAAACYCAYLGLESISRFGAFCGVLLIAVVLVVLLLNVKSLDALNFYPGIVNSRSSIFSNALLISSNTIEPAIVLVISDRVKGKPAGAMLAGVALSLAVVLMLVAFTIGALGSAASLHAFPIYALFRMASSEVMSRLDIIHTSFWILGVLVKCSLLIYCSTLFTKKVKNGTKCVASSLLAVAISVVLVYALGSAMSAPVRLALVLLYGVFVVALPVIMLISGRSSDEAD